MQPFAWEYSGHEGIKSYATLQRHIPVEISAIGKHTIHSRTRLKGNTVYSS